MTHRSFGTLLTSIDPNKQLFTEQTESSASEGQIDGFLGADDEDDDTIFFVSLRNQNTGSSNQAPYGKQAGI